MNTAWLAHPSNDSVLNDSSTVEHELTRIRAETPRDVETSDRAGEHVDESPIARLILSHSRPSAPPLTKTPVPAPRSGVQPLPITVLTTDKTFASQFRTALDSSWDVQVVATEDSAAELAAAGRCPIFVTDNLMPRSALAALTARLRAHDPSTVVIVSGARDQGGAFVGLQSSGIVDGFLLKPVTAASTQLVLDAATRRHQAPTIAAPSQRTRHRTRAKPPTVRSDLDSSETIEAHVRPKVAFDVAPIPKAEPTKPRPPVARVLWPVVVLIAALIAGAVWWLKPDRSIDVAALATKHLALADDAYAAGRLVDARDGAVHHYQTVLAVDSQNLAAHRGLDRVAAELSRNTQAHMSKRNLPDAALSLQRLRDLQPDYPELPLLQAQLQSLQEAVVASHSLATVPTPAPAAVNVKATRSAAPSATRESSPARNDNASTLASTVIQSNRTQNDRAATLPSAAPAASSSKKIESGASANSQDASPAPSIDQTPSNDPARTSEAAPATQLVSVRLPTLPTAPPTVAQPSQQPAESAAPTVAKAPELVKYVPPSYPSEAFARGMEGWIQVGMEVTPSGDVINPRIEGGEKRQLFGRAALAAVRQWKYAPSASRTTGEQLSVRLEFKMESRR